MAKKRMTFTLDEELLAKLKEASEETMIPQAKIVQKAIEKQLKEMGKYKHHIFFNRSKILSSFLLSKPCSFPRLQFRAILDAL